METPQLPPEQLEPGISDNPPTPTTIEQKQQQRYLIIAIAVGVIILVIFLGLVAYLLQPSTPTDKIRDVFIIIVALESFVIGVALIVLIVQLASLINLMQNEVKPILQATNETVNTLRGTTQFLGENAVEPVIKIGGYLAGLNRMLELMGIRRK